MQIAEMSRRHDPSNELHRLEAAVRSRLNGRVRSFRLLVLSDGLVLQGEAYTYYAKQLVQHAIMEATDLPILANDVVVIS